MKDLVCWNCGHSLDDIPRPISRHATCSQCFNELHCCRLCRHFDPKRNMQCFEDRADPPLQKENANFCDFFSPSRNAFQQRTVDQSDQARGELDALFGDAPADEAADADPATEDADPAPGEEAAAGDEADSTPPLSKEEEARKRLDDLFN